MDDEVMLPQWTLVCAMRYAMGRRSYIVRDVTALVRSMWGELSQHTRGVVRSDLASEIDMHDRMTKGSPPISWLGDEGDVNEWRRLMEFISCKR